MSSLKRSLHRSVAVLLLPLGLLLIQAEVITRNLSGVVESPVPGLSRWVSRCSLERRCTSSPAVSDNLPRPRIPPFDPRPGPAP
ncbi:hypothetical protein RBH20_00440 [Haloarcula sp. H-GB4]|uniref:hypothetical protein n=1 Tax=Haloarcula sp. H-GB4 TaxID=3069755 RepID=UPI0027B0CBA7|nr:hypothetical protein [Haloarcula sp. H-GB4]MDQ2070994.1 hypothetical protein [Haloarcula sp. H-GB4]